MAQQKESAGKQLTLTDLFGMSIGIVIGTGVMTMTGIAIGITGRSANIAYMIAAVISIISSIPPIFISGTANFEGGQYSQIGSLAGKNWGGIFTYLNIAMMCTGTLTAMSFAQYFTSLVPGVNPRLVSIGIVTILTILHTCAVKNAARLQNLMVIVLILALGVYIIYGMPNVTPDYFQNPGFMTNGAFGVVHASFYLTMAIGGATYVVNYSVKAKNPVRDIPIVIIFTTIGVAILYTFIATVAAGVLPLEQVAGKPLSIAAESFMPGGMYTFFVVGGAIFALLTTLNGGLGYKVYPVITASKDGWLPQFLQQRNQKFGTPHWGFLVIYLITVVPIAAGIDIAVVANSTVILVTCIRVLVAISALNLTKVMPDLWNKSKFHVSDGKLKFICYLSIVVNIGSVLLLIFTSSTTAIIGNSVILIAAVALTFLRKKKANMSVSWQEF